MYYVHKIIAKLTRRVSDAAARLAHRALASSGVRFQQYKAQRRAALIDSLSESAEYQAGVQRWVAQRRAELVAAEEQAAALHAGNITKVGNALDQLRLEQL